MKTIIVLAVALLCACANGTEANVLTSDGSKKLGYCNGISWIQCSHELCPNGYDIIAVDTSLGASPSIIKCKDASQLQCGGDGVIKCKPW